MNQSLNNLPLQSQVATTITKQLEQNKITLKDKQWD